MITDPELLKGLMQQGGLLPKEEMLEVKRKKGSLFIGVPKESAFQERRVGLVPETVTVEPVSPVSEPAGPPVPPLTL